MAVPYSRFVVGSITWYSVLIMAGILLAYLLGSREEKRLGLKKDTMLDIVLIAVPAGIIGSRIYYVLMKLDEYIADPVSILYIWNGGVAIYGAVIGGVLALWIYSRAKKIPFASIVDLVAPGLILAQAIGRWGNYFNAEAYGPVITNAFWQFFPAGVLISEGGQEVWHVATFFYESMWNFATFAVLWFTRKRMKRRGDLFLWYMVLYGCGRFLVEQLRTDSLYLLGMRVSQIVSLLMCVGVAVVFLVRLYPREKSRPFAAYLLLCFLMFLRPLLAASLEGTVITLALYICCIGGLLFFTGKDRLAIAWTGIDFLVYLMLWIFGGQWLWQSPYFLYAGISVAVYIAMIYKKLDVEETDAGNNT
jgi:phosphatidylglycerol---prolipoprotein diacylglyceryl transferase